MDESAGGAPGFSDLSRPTPRQGDQPQPLPKHTPGILAISERKRADFWRNASLAVCLGALILSYLTIKAGRATEVIHVMDPAGNMYAGPVGPMSESSRFFHVTSIYATNAALQRSSAGFDLFELLKLYYSPRAIAKLQEDQKKREPDLRRRNLQWKPIIDSIGDPVATGPARTVEVRGRVIAAGAYANRSFYDELPFTLILGFVRNPDLGKSGAYPWICQDAELKLVETPRRKS